MARSFDSASSQYLQADAAVVSDVPISMGCGFSANDVTNNHVLMWIGDKDSTKNWYWLRAAGGEAGDPIDAWHRDDTSTIGDMPETTTGFSANTPHNALTVFESDDSRSVWIDGGSKDTTTVNVSGAIAVDRIAIGRTADSTPGGYSDASVSDAVVYNATLSDGEAEAPEWCPLLIKLESIASYYPLGGLFTEDDTDLVGTADLTPINSPTWTDHPNVIYPCDPMQVQFTAVAPGVTIPVLQQNMRGGFNQMRGGFTNG